MNTTLNPDPVRPALHVRIANRASRATLLGVIARPPEVKAGLLFFVLAGQERVLLDDGRERDSIFYQRCCAEGRFARSLRDLPAGTAVEITGALRSIESQRSGRPEARLEVLVKSAVRIAVTPQRLVRDAGGGMRLLSATNELVALGRLGQDARTGELEGGRAVVDARLAVPTGDRERPLWLDLAAYGEKAECLSGKRKGNAVLVRGRLLSERRERAQGGSATFSRLEVRQLEDLPQEDIWL